MTFSKGTVESLVAMQALETWRSHANATTPSAHWCSHWDRGTWQPESTDVDASLQKGEMKFTLYVTKLQGSWVLVSTRAWGHSCSVDLATHQTLRSIASTSDMTQEEPRSVASQRLLAGVARDEGGDVERVSLGDRGGKLLRRTTAARSAARGSGRDEGQDSISRSAHAGELATLVPGPFQEPGWVYGEKYDGFRILAYKERSGVSLLSTNGKDHTQTYADVAAAVAKLADRTLLLDEVVEDAKQQAPATLEGVLFPNVPDLWVSTVQAENVTQ